MVALFNWLPLVLGAAIVFHTGVAWLGVGLLWRRPWARRATLALARVGRRPRRSASAIARLVALAVSRGGYPEPASFAHVAQALAAQVTLVDLVLATLLVLLLMPAVRAQFSAGR